LSGREHRRPSTSAISEIVIAALGGASGGVLSSTFQDSREGQTWNRNLWWMADELRTWKASEAMAKV
jgi:hypothetical protein